MAGHTDKYAKFAFCKYLQSKGYTDVKIINAPVDISAKLGNDTWWFELKKTAQQKKYFGATTLTELEQAQLDPLHFRFIIAKADTPEEECFSFTFYELSLEQMIAIGEMSIPPFKVYFNISIDSISLNKQITCYKYSSAYDETEYTKLKSCSSRNVEKITFKAEHISRLSQYHEEIQRYDSDNQIDCNKKYLYRVDRRNYKKQDEIFATGEYFNALSQDKIIVENYLEQIRPQHIISRRDALFVFDDIRDAVKFCSKIHGSYIYAVLPRNTEGMHKADMNIVELIHKLKNHDEQLIWARNYWNVECVVGYPCYEYLISSAIVQKKLLSHIECQSMIKSPLYMYKHIAEIL